MDNYNKKSIIDIYTTLSRSWGLWTSEKDIITKYSNLCDSIIDIGCGTGRVAIGLALIGYDHITALDISDLMITRAIEESKRMNLDNYINHIIADISNYEENEKYDLAIFSYNGIHCIKGDIQRKNAIKNIAKLLKKNGTFIFTTHQCIDDTSSKYYDFWEKRKNEFRAVNETMNDYKDLLIEDCGEEIYNHFFEYKDIYNLLVSDFTIEKTFLRDYEYKEHTKITSVSNNCLFWICKKI